MLMLIWSILAHILSFKLNSLDWLENTAIQDSIQNKPVKGICQPFTEVLPHTFSVCSMINNCSQHPSYTSEIMAYIAEKPPLNTLLPLKSSSCIATVWKKKLSIPLNKIFPLNEPCVCLHSTAYRIGRKTWSIILPPKENFCWFSFSGSYTPSFAYVQYMCLV